MFSLTRVFVCFLMFFSTYSCGQQQQQFTYKKLPQKYQRLDSDISIPANFTDVLDHLPKNYVKDGTIDYTSSIQHVLDKYKNIKFPDFPLMINDKGLVVHSNTHLYFQKNSKIILKASNKEKYDILNLNGVENVTIENANIEGDKQRHIGKSGEWGMGIGIRGSSNVVIKDAHIYNCWGDGIYIGQTNYIPSSNIKILRAFLDANRRNGLSITSGFKIRISNVTISNTFGTLPMCGIDIEPNSNKDIVDDITIENAITYNNFNSGIVIGIGKLIGQSPKNVNIKIDNHIDDSSKIGFYLGGILPVDRRSGKNIKGEITVTSPKWLNNRDRPLLTRRAFGRGPKTVIQNLSVDEVDLNSHNLEKLKNNFRNNLEIVIK